MHELEGEGADMPPSLLNNFRKLYRKTGDCIASSTISCYLRHACRSFHFVLSDQRRARFVYSMQSCRTQRQKKKPGAGSLPPGYRRPLKWGVIGLLPSHHPTPFWYLSNWTEVQPGRKSFTTHLGVPFFSVEGRGQRNNQAT